MFAQLLIEISPASSRRATRIGRSMSRLQMQACRPYSLSLASATASSSVSNTCSVCTGPNTSFCTIGIDGSVTSSSVGW